MTRRRRVGAGGGSNGGYRHGRVLPGAAHPGEGGHGGRHPDVADQHNRQPLGREPRGVEVEQLEPVDVLDRRGRALRRAPVRMVGAIKQGHHRLERPGGRAVRVLAKLCQELAAACLDLLLGTAWRAHHVAHGLEHRLDVVGQTIAGHGGGMTRHAHERRHAAQIEDIGDLIGRACPGAAVQQPRQQMGDPLRTRRVAHTARRHGGANRHRRLCMSLLDEQGDPVGQPLAQRGETGTRCRGHAGWNQPVVRLLTIR